MRLLFSGTVAGVVTFPSGAGPVINGSDCTAQPTGAAAGTGARVPLGKTKGAFMLFRRCILGIDWCTLGSLGSVVLFALFRLQLIFPGFHLLCSELCGRATSLPPYPRSQKCVISGNMSRVNHDALTLHH